MANHHGSSTSDSDTTAVKNRISSLPDDILHHILSFLPMKDAIRTSILSKRWRFLWTFNRNLDFPIENKHEPIVQETFIPIITRCLRLHNSPTINRFLVRILIVRDITPHVETWLRFATSKGVRQLVLQIYPWNHFRLPEFLFSHTPLQELMLYRCTINLPLEFKGFPFLKVLELHNVSIDDQTVKTILFTCPLLEKLVLMEVRELVNLNVSSAPNLSLRILKVGGCFALKKLLVNAPNLVFFAYEDYGRYNSTKICLENVPCLREADVSFGENGRSENIHEWTALVKSIANFESLTVDNWFSQVIFAEYYVSGTPYIAFMNLKEFNWSCDLHYQHEILAFASFLGDCSSLQKLCINVLHQNSLFDWDYCYETLITLYPPSEEAARIIDKEDLNLDHFDYVLHHLKRIEIVGFSGTKNQLELVRFLLNKSIILDLLLVISVRKEDESEDEKEDYIPNWNLRDHFSRLPKRSLNAKIVVSGPPPELPPPPEHMYEGYSSDDFH